MAGPALFEIEHVSRYTYTSPVRHCVMALCMKPRDDDGQRLVHFEASTAPRASLNDELDGFGNTKQVLTLHRAHQVLEVTARSTVETTRSAPLSDSPDGCAWEETRTSKGSFAQWDFTHASALARPTSALADFVNRRDIASRGAPVESLLRLSNTLHDSFEYVPGSTSVVSPIDHILESGRGVCQDYAHVMIAIARSWGVPTRYVSGYVHVKRAGGRTPETASHAWVECWLSDLGWVGFDPTNNRLVDERYVTVAVGRDYQDVAPTRGVLIGGGETSLEVSVRMRALDPSTRQT